MYIFMSVCTYESVPFMYRKIYGKFEAISVNNIDHLNLYFSCMCVGR